MANEELGTLREVDNGYELRFERHFEQPVEEVWQAITEPEHLAEWIGASAVDLRPGPDQDSTKRAAPALTAR